MPINTARSNEWRQIASSIEEIYAMQCVAYDAPDLVFKSGDKIIEISLEEATQMVSIKK